MIILIKLIIAHFIGDFLLQPKSWVVEKEKRKARYFKLYLHFLIHGILVFVLLWNFNIWLLALLLMVSHGIIDVIKLYFQKESHKFQLFIIDQVLHILSIIVLWLIFFKQELDFSIWCENGDIWIYILSILFLTNVTGIIMREFMSKWSKTLKDKHEESLNNAGKYIGFLERLLVFVFVVTANWEGIGFLLAAKSVFRFGDLKESKDRKLTEYILIGTLLSFGIAIATGMLVLKLIEN